MTGETPRRSFFSLPEIWEFCLVKIYDKPAYVADFERALTERGITKDSHILDAGCGSGFPSLDLVERGYHITATDKSSEMVRQIGRNAERRGLRIDAHHVMWSELADHFGPEFDVVYCRGNSLVYAASWEQNWIVPDRSREEIRSALRNFFHVLKPGGFLYVDITHPDEKPGKQDLGMVETAAGPLELTWEMRHDTTNGIRTWTMTLRSRKTGEEQVYPSYSYLLRPAELLTGLRDAGFKRIEENVRLPAETHYAVFVAHT